MFHINSVGGTVTHFLKEYSMYRSKERKYKSIDHNSVSEVLGKITFSQLFVENVAYLKKPTYKRGQINNKKI